MSKNANTKIILEYPVEYQGRPVAEVIVRRPKGRDMRFFPKVGDQFSPEDMYPFYAQLMVLQTGEAPGEEFIDDMDMADINQVSEAVTAFLERRKRATQPRIKSVK